MLHFKCDEGLKLKPNKRNLKNIGKWFTKLKNNKILPKIKEAFKNVIEIVIKIKIFNFYVQIRFCQ